MRIFTAVRHAIDPRQFYGGLWSGNFYPALRQMGHEIVESQVDLLPTSRFMNIPDQFTPEELEARARTTEQILEELAAARNAGPVDLFLSYFYNSHFDPAAFDRIRAWGIPSINFYCNSIYQFDNVVAIAAKVDVSWHAERDARASYLSVGAKPVWVQMGADPDVYRPIDARREPKACFVGQNYADRAMWMSALINAGVPVEIYGFGWGGPEPSQAATPVEATYLGRAQFVPGSAAAYGKTVLDTFQQHGLVGGTRRIVSRLAYRGSQHAEVFMPHARGPIPFGQLLEVFGRHEVCLNFSNVWAEGHSGSAPIAHVRLRDFEAPMCRTCYLTGYSDEITEFYELGTEIDAYRTTEELIDKTKFYLSNPSAAEQLRERGYQRARHHHTWQHRFAELFDKAGLS